VTYPPPVRDEIEMESVKSIRWHHLLQDSVGLLPRYLWPDEAQSPADAMHVGIHRKGGHAQSKEEHDGCGFRSHAVQTGQPGFGLVEGQV